MCEDDWFFISDLFCYGTEAMVPLLFFCKLDPMSFKFLECVDSKIICILLLLLL